MENQPSQSQIHQPHEIAIALLELRVANTNNKNTVKILNKIISDVNLTMNR